MKWKPTKAASSTLSSVPHVAGQAIFLYDTQELYWDSTDAKRVQITDVIVLPDEAARTATLAPLNKFYYVEATNVLWRFDATGWKRVTGEDIAAKIEEHNTSTTAHANMHWGDMLAATYDPTGKAEDMFGYVDRKTPWELVTEPPVLEGVVVPAGGSVTFETPLTLVEDDRYFLVYEYTDGYDFYKRHYEKLVKVELDTNNNPFIYSVDVDIQPAQATDLMSNGPITIVKLAKVSKLNGIPGYLLAGAECIASGEDSRAEGYNTTASGDNSHAEGGFTTASGYNSHSEGSSTTASGEDSHAEGSSTTASGKHSHAEGSSTTASGKYSHAEGCRNIASSSFQHVQGKYNIEDAADKYAHIVGNGSSNSACSNAHCRIVKHIGQ